tara:strand:+ start:330 stop:791 length:462 start_codon:yes stop_codon:yes gene_type:complete
MSITKEIWGNNIWYLFHTIAYKIKDDEFVNCKQDLIFIFTNICNNLPCPECSADANKTIQKINFDNINTKYDFKILLYNFHNYVNKKLNKPEFDINMLDIKYSKANIDNIYNNFFIIFSSNSNIPQLMGSSFHRQQIYPKIKSILLNLKNKFE